MRTTKPPHTGIGADELGAFIKSVRQQNFSPKTIDTRRRAIRDLLEYLGGQGRDRLADVLLSDLEGYCTHIMERGFNLNSVNAYLWSVRRFFNFLDEGQFIFENPAEGLRIPRPNRALQPVPTQQEMQNLLEQPDTETNIGVRDRAILEVMYSTGVRRGELLGMKMSDAEYDEGRIRVMGKGQKERVVPIGKEASRWLKIYICEARRKLIGKQEESPRLWITKDGRAISGVRVDQMIRNYVKQAGISQRISAHSLRRACATHMLMNGAHPVQLQMLLGHASLKSLSQYLQISITDMIKTHKKTRPGQ